MKDPQKAFGSWDDHIEWMTSKYVDELWSAARIADELEGINHQQVRHRLINSDVEMRDPSAVHN